MPDSVLRQFISTLCVCGAEKETRRSFCRSCYFRLPEAMRTALWKRIGHGYHEAYRAACHWLGHGSGEEAPQ